MIFSINCTYQFAVVTWTTVTVDNGATDLLTAAEIKVFKCKEDCWAPDIKDCDLKCRMDCQTDCETK